MLGCVCYRMPLQTATLAQAQAGVAAGASLITHLYNAMPPLSHREPGVLGLLAAAATSQHTHPSMDGTAATCELGTNGDAGAVASTPVVHDVHATSCSTSGGKCTTSSGTTPQPSYSLIADGVHVHPAAVAVAWQSHPSGCILVTDAMCALGLPPGHHMYGDLPVTVHAGCKEGDGVYDGLHVVLRGSSTLAGAVQPLDLCMANFKRFTGCTLGEALRTVTGAPRKLLGLPQPTWAVGSPATCVIVDSQLRLLATYVDGELVKPMSKGIT